jgi:twitching motility protein PilT
MTMIELFTEGVITEESALLYCTNKGVVSRGLDNVKKERGEDTSGLAGLKMDSQYGKN